MCMVAVHDDLLQEARLLSSFSDDSEIVNNALEAFIRQKKNKPRVLGSLAGKVSVTFADDWKTSTEEFLKA